MRSARSGSAAANTCATVPNAIPLSEDRANRVELRVLDRDSHSDAVPWPGPSIGSVPDPTLGCRQLGGGLHWDTRLFG
jgi:hypothetical protein